MRDLGPTPGIDPHRAGLFAQVGVLPARHRMFVDLGHARTQVAFERGVVAAHAFPIAGQAAQGAAIKARITVRALQGLADRTKVRLRGEPGHRVHCCVRGVHPGIGCSENGRRRNARCVVGVEVDW